MRTGTSRPGFWRSKQSALAHQRRELLRFRVEGEHFRRGDLEEPAVQPKRAIHQPFLHAGIVVQIVESEQNIFLRGGGLTRRRRMKMRVVLFQRLQNGRRELEPVAQMRRRIADRLSPSRAAIAPHWEWPQMTMSLTRKFSMANSMAAAVEFVSPQTLAGGTMLPTF